MPEHVIRDASGTDAAAVAGIYNHYIEHGIATFEETPLEPVDLALRMEETAALGLPWLVAGTDGGVVGYAYASRWKGRCAYRFSVEITVYLAPDYTGSGLGTQLYTALFARLREGGYHAVIAGIALPNPASIALHEKFGMRKVAQFSEVGFKFGGWIDVGYWQCLLDDGEHAGR